MKAIFTDKIIELKPEFLTFHTERGGFFCKKIMCELFPQAGTGSKIYTYDYPVPRCKKLHVARSEYTRSWYIEDGYITPSNTDLLKMLNTLEPKYLWVRVTKCR